MPAESINWVLSPILRSLKGRVMLADMLTPEQLIAIIHALADVAPWIALVTLAIVFRPEFRNLMGRLRRARS